MTLNTRGDEGTGWSKAWKHKFLGRSLHDGNRSSCIIALSAMKLTVPQMPFRWCIYNLF